MPSGVRLVSRGRSATLSVCRSSAQADSAAGSVSAQNRRRRLAATRADTAAVDRRSSIGRISSSSSRAASSMLAPAGKRLLPLTQADDRRGDAAERDARLRPAHRGHHDLRDRLRRARADFAEPLPALDGGNLERRRSARPAAARSRDSRCRTSTNGTRRSPSTLRSTTIASAAASTGSVSPAGEALATLPPSVPRFWIWTPPTSRAALTSIGRRRRTSARTDEVGVGRQRADAERRLRAARCAQRVEAPEVEESRRGERAEVERRRRGRWRRPAA